MITDMDAYHLQEIKNSDNTTRALNALKSVKEKMSVSDTIIGELKARIDSTEHMSFFIERSLPVQLHLMVSEHLRAILAKEKHPDLLKYEIEKMDQIFKYNKTNRGYQPNLSLLNDRLYLFAEHYYKEKKGVVPFVWGRDFLPNMPVLEAEYIPPSIFYERDEFVRKWDKE